MRHMIPPPRRSFLKCPANRGYIGNEEPSKTRSEELFEFFLSRNRIQFDKLEEASSPRPDYLVEIGAVKVIFEVKELTRDIREADGAFQITTGNSIRSLINGSRKQIQYGAKTLGLPSVLLIYNRADQLQMLGTDDRDFLAAMYGEYTVLVSHRTGRASEPFHGKNQSLQESKNTSFSAVGRLKDSTKDVSVTLFENVFALIPLPSERIPSCFDVRQVRLSQEADGSE